MVFERDELLVKTVVETHSSDRWVTIIREYFMMMLKKLVV